MMLYRKSILVRCFFLAVHTKKKHTRHATDGDTLATCVVQHGS